MIMKKFLYIPMMLMAACVCFSSCSDDDDNGTVMNQESPATVAEATYNGTWTKTLVGTKNSETSTGSVVVSKITDNTIILNMNGTSFPLTKDNELNCNCNANIQWASYGLSFFNKYAKNKLEYGFNGTIIDGKINFEYDQKIYVGRKLYKYRFAFEGTK